MKGFSREQLINKAMEARKGSYSPYSGFAVGAALLCEDGSVITGCNIENAAYGPTICAERVAVFKAISDGKRNFKAIAIVGSPAGEQINQFAFPCGVCRQVLREFCSPEDFTVVIAKNEKEYKELSLSALLPESFGPDNLK